MLVDDDKAKDKSLPLRERGLKSRRPRQHPENTGRSLYGSVD